MIASELLNITENPISKEREMFPLSRTCHEAAKALEASAQKNQAIGQAFCQMTKTSEILWRETLSVGQEYCQIIKERPLASFQDSTLVAFRRSMAPHKTAFQVLSEHGDVESMKSLARRLDLELIYDDELPTRVGGLIDSDDQGPYIVINARHSLRVQEDSISHEIGHCVLGHLNQRRRPTRELDAEANAFAGTFFLLWNPHISSFKRLQKDWQEVYNNLKQSSEIKLKLSKLLIQTWIQ